MANNAINLENIWGTIGAVTRDQQIPNTRT